MLNLHQTISSQFVGADQVSIFLVFLPLLILIKNLSGFPEENIPLLEVSMIIVEREARHVGGGWIIFHKRGRNENYQWRPLELLYQPKVLCTMHCANSCGFLKLSFL
jgi:hypothetical protein